MAHAAKCNDCVLELALELLHQPIESRPQGLDGSGNPTSHTPLRRSDKVDVTEVLAWAIGGETNWQGQYDRIMELLTYETEDDIVEDVMDNEAADILPFPSK